MKKRKDRPTAKLILAPNPLLTTVCELVEDGEDVSGIIRDMMYILINSEHGVGLAASQVGRLKRIILIKVNVEWGYIAMINPSIAPYSDSFVTLEEGCLSYPGIYKPIERRTAILTAYTSENGIPIVNHRFDNFPARIIQHEIDHLDGKCKVGEK